MGANHPHTTMKKEHLEIINDALDAYEEQMERAAGAEADEQNAEAHKALEDIKRTREYLADEAEYFPVTRLSRADFHSKGYNPDKLTDEQMERIADEMGDGYVEQMFWEQIDQIADEYNLPTNDGEEE